MMLAQRWLEANTNILLLVIDVHGFGTQEVG